MLIQIKRVQKVLRLGRKTWRPWVATKLGIGPPRPQRDVAAWEQFNRRVAAVYTTGIVDPAIALPADMHGDGGDANAWQPSNAELWSALRMRIDEKLQRVRAAYARPHAPNGTHNPMLTEILRQLHAIRAELEYIQAGASAGAAGAATTHAQGSGLDTWTTWYEGVVDAATVASANVATDVDTAGIPDDPEGDD